MTTALIFGAVLLLGSLLSGTASRTAISTSVLYLGAGFVFGNGVLGWLPLSGGDDTVKHLADLALVAVLFPDGMRIGVRELRAAWHLPGRALLVGMPLTFAAIAVVARLTTDLSWPLCLLAAAVLSPTDPVFASALIDRDSISRPLRRLLNVESGLNDGLALPLVFGLLAWIGATQASIPVLLAEVVGGVVLGIVIPWAANFMRVRLRTSMVDLYVPLFAVAVAVLVYALARLSGVNQFLAAFAAGATLTSLCQDLVDRIHDFAERIAELFKIAALLAFGALIDPHQLLQLGWSGWLFTIGVLVFARTLSVCLALVGSQLPGRERLVAGLFGPKGFASVVYAIIVLNTGSPDAGRLFHLVALVVIVSIVVDSSTDVAVARWLQRAGQPQREG